MIADDMGRWQAAASRSMRGIGWGVDVWLYQRVESGLIVVDHVDTSMTVRNEGHEEFRPSFTLEDHMGRALLDALANHYGGASDVRRLDADLAYERKRSDRMLDTLLGVAGRVSH